MTGKRAVVGCRRDDKCSSKNSNNAPVLYFANIVEGITKTVFFLKHVSSFVFLELTCGATRMTS